MATTDKLFAGPIPELYERFLVPLIFESYARDLAKRVAETKPQDVLETAAGTGVLTRAMASCLPAAARIVATDLNAPMLEEATKRQAGDRRIEWRQADALALPFPVESFDVVACQFAAMFFPGKVGAYKEARRVLRSGGHFMFNVWDRISENEFADVVTQALAAIFPDDPPRSARLSRFGANQAGPERARIFGYCGCRRGRDKQSAIAARGGRRLLPWNAAAQ
jgi:SAM-dependent methyltransferase